MELALDALTIADDYEMRRLRLEDLRSKTTSSTEAQHLTRLIGEANGNLRYQLKLAEIHATLAVAEASR